MTEQNVSCTILQPDYSNIEVVHIVPRCDSNNESSAQAMDYQIAMQQANQIAEEKLHDYMLLSWYDRDRDFEQGRYVFFYRSF